MVVLKPYDKKKKYGVNDQSLVDHGGIETVQNVYRFRTLAKSLVDHGGIETPIRCAFDSRRVHGSLVDHGGIETA